MEKHKTCSFFGHRKIDVSDNLTQRIKDCLEYLIVKCNVKNFLFGSKSDFNDLCHLVVSELKVKYSNIKRICYTCKSEGCTLEIERQEREKIYSRFLNSNVRLLGFEEEFEHETKHKAGKASYIERNQAMIDDSGYCVFYYDKNYFPEKRKHSKRAFCYYQPKSGTALAHTYAKQKKKFLINILDTNK